MATKSTGRRAPAVASRLRGGRREDHPVPQPPRAQSAQSAAGPRTRCQEGHEEQETCRGASLFYGRRRRFDLPRRRTGRSADQWGIAPAPQLRASGSEPWPLGFRVLFRGHRDLRPRRAGSCPAPRAPPAMAAASAGPKVPDEMSRRAAPVLAAPDLTPRVHRVSPHLQVRFRRSRLLRPDRAATRVRLYDCIHDWKPAIRHAQPVPNGLPVLRQLGRTHRAISLR
jgi:hypothetical protein